MGFEHLSGERFLSLVTYRRSGERVATPVWFTTDAEMIFIGTFENSGKVHRLSRNDAVEVAPCNFRGLVRGAYVGGLAVVLDETVHERASSSLAAKYGWQWELFSGRIDTYIGVSPQPDSV